jgi:hypothetical protein
MYQMGSLNTIKHPTEEKKFQDLTKKDREIYHLNVQNDTLLIEVKN